MNEEAILDSYNLFKGGGYNGSIEDYKQLINTNSEAVKDSYSLFQKSGYTDSQEDYEGLLGLKKKDSSEPTSTDPELASTSTTEETPTDSGIGEIELSDKELGIEKPWDIQEFTQDSDRKEIYDQLKEFSQEELTSMGVESVPDTYEEYVTQNPTDKEKIAEIDSKDLMYADREEELNKVKTDRELSTTKAQQGQYDAISNYAEQKHGLELNALVKDDVKFTKEDRATAQKNLERIESGNLTFGESLEATLLGMWEDPAGALPFADKPWFSDKFEPVMPETDYKQERAKIMDSKFAKVMDSLDGDQQQAYKNFQLFSPEGAASNLEKLSDDSVEVLKKSSFTQEKLEESIEHPLVKGFTDAFSISKEVGDDYIKNLSASDQKEFFKEHKKVIGLIDTHEGLLEQWNGLDDDLQSYETEVDLAKKHFGKGTNLAIGYINSVARIGGGVLDAIQDPLIEASKPEGMSTQEFRDKFMKDSWSTRLDDTIKENEAISRGAKLDDRWYSPYRIALLSAEQLPVLAVTVGTGAAGLGRSTGIGFLSASVYGNKVREYGELKGEVNYEDRFAGFLAAGAEFVSEQVTLGILAKGGRAFNVAKKGKFTDLFSKNFAKGLVKGSVIEGNSEVMAQFGENFADIYIAKLQGKHIFDGFPEAWRSGAIMGSMFRGMPEVAGAVIGQYFGDTAQLNNIQETDKRIKKLIGEGLNPDISDGMFDVITKKIDKLQKVNKERVNKLVEDVENLSDENIDRLINLGDLSADARKELATIRKDKTISPDLKQELEHDKELEIEQLDEKKVEVLEKSKIPPVIERTKDIKIERAPKGTFINVGMKRNKTNEDITEKEIKDALPKDVKVLESGIKTVKSEGGTEDTMSLKLSRPLDDSEMKDYLEVTDQMAIPQISEGKGAMYGTKDWGDFNSEFFSMPDNQQLSDVINPKTIGKEVKPTVAKKETLTEKTKGITIDKQEKKPVSKGELKGNTYTTNKGEEFDIEIFDGINGKVNSFEDRKRKDRFSLAVTNEKGEVAGNLGLWENSDGTWYANIVDVLEKHRRKGIATIMYDFAESKGIEIVDSKEQTERGKLFKANRNQKNPITKSKDNKPQSKAKDTQGFFSDVVGGKSNKYKPSKKYRYEQVFSTIQEKFRNIYDSMKGNFDEHIATSIPTFRDNQVKKGSAVVKLLKGVKNSLIYDIGGSEGSWLKTVVKESGAKGVNLDPNNEMEKSFNQKPVKGASYIKEAFHEGFDDIKAHKPKEKADVVHESMVFQFIQEGRKEYVEEVVGNYLKEDGVFITEEKFKLDDKSEYKDNEELKDSKHKSKYYTEEQRKSKGEEVLVGMSENQHNYNNYVNLLKNSFKYVETYWTAGNFKGIIATNNKSKLDSFMQEVGDNTNNYTTKNKGTKTKFKGAADNIRKNLKTGSSIKESLKDLSSGLPKGALDLAWDTAIEVVAQVIETTGDIAQAIEQGLKSLEQSDWYKSLNPKSKSKVNGSFKDSIKKEFNNKGGDKAPTESKFNIKKLFSGMPVLSYLDDVFYRNVTSGIDSTISKLVTKGLESKNKVSRVISQTATNWFNGLPRTVKELARARRLSGDQDLASVMGAKLTKELQGIIKSDPETAMRVHRVLDPDMYEDGVTLSYEELTDNEKFLYDELVDLNSQTHELNYQHGFITEETYEKYKGKYIARLYEEFENIENEKDGLVKKMNRITPDIYKERKAIDQWKVDNKVTDPIYLTINRMIKTARNVAVKTYAEEIAETKAITEPKAGYEKVEGKRYGALSGMYVPQYIVEDFKGYFFTNGFVDAIYDGIKIYDRSVARQVLKKSHTVWNPVVQIGNLVSNFAFSFVTGVNAVQMVKNLPAAQKTISDKGEVYQTLIKAGIIGSNVLTNDLRMNKDTESDNLRLKGVKEKVKSVGQKIASPFVAADKWATKKYGASDDIMKIAAYISLVEVGYTQTEAIEKVFDGMQNYATVGKVWDAAAKTPIIGNAYIKFQADLMRITKNAVIKRPLTTASFLATLKAISILASSLSGEDDDEREIREGRGYIPKIRLGFTDIPLVFKAGGKEVNLARFISPYYTYHIPSDGTLEHVTGMLPYQFRTTEDAEMGQTGMLPEAQDVLLGGLVQAFFYNKDFRNKSVSDPYATRYKESGLTDSEKILNKVMYVGRSTIPASSTVQDIYLSATTGEDFYGRTKSTGDVLISQFIKTQTYGKPELEKTIESSFKTLEYKSKKVDARIDAVDKKFVRDAGEYAKKVDEGKMSDVKASRNTEKLYQASVKRIDAHMGELVKIQDDYNQLLEKVKKMGY
tara:strand:+ start:2167 stop:9024 length:6858 start_codon:yes stop_codon:yes gene_type:complete